MCGHMQRHTGYDNPCISYDVDGIQIETVDEENDMGVIISRAVELTRLINALMR